jgi:hypothetical protein
MTTRLATYFACTGITALLVVVFPGVVLVGLFAGVLPGILLGLAPSVFMYSLLWWGLYVLIRRSVPLVATTTPNDITRRPIGRSVVAIAALILAAFAVVVPYTVNVRFDPLVAELRADDKEPTTISNLPPVISVLDRDSFGKDNYCNSLCLRLLYNGAVSRVVVANGRKTATPAAFWIERRDNCPEPAIKSHGYEVWPGELSSQRPNHIEGRVRARISAGECLLQGTGDINEAGAVISIGKVRNGANIFGHPWALWLDTITATRMEIVQSDGRLLYRRTEVVSNPLSVPLVVETRAGLLTSVTYAGWGRSEQKLSPIGTKGRDALSGLLGSQARLPDLPKL